MGKTPESFGFRRECGKLQASLPKGAMICMRGPDKGNELVKLARLREAAALMKIALPLIMAYLADILTVVIAKAVIGKLGFHELAAAGVAADVSIQMAIVLMGFFSVVGVVISEAIGARRRQDILPALLQGLGIAAVLGAVLTVIVMNIGPVLRFAGQDEAVIALAGPFASRFCWAMLPIILFSVLRSLAAALMRTGAVMAITVVNAFLTYGLMQGLVHGGFGLPALGLEGAGIAWAMAAWFKALALAAVTVWLIAGEKLPPADPGAFVRLFRLGHLVRLGLPVAGIVALESGLFAAVSLLSGWLGAEALAAYQMVMGWISVPFIVSLGLAEAAMVRVSFWMGAEDAAAARRAGNLGMAIGVAIPFALIVIPLAAPQLITRIFLDATDPGYPAIAALVARLLVIAAIFQVFDGLQAIASHALRGLRDAAMPLVIAGIGYWIVGLGSAYALAFTFGWGVVGLWWGLALGLIFTGSLLALRFERLARARLA
jgi:multidrug resistance protein, MATE family